jgi:RNA polymerase sigma-70 factor, ECF subfamily
VLQDSIGISWKHSCVPTAKNPETHNPALSDVHRRQGFLCYNFSMEGLTTPPEIISKIDREVLLQQLLSPEFRFEIRNFLLSINCSLNDIDDMTQETLIKANRSIDQFNHRSALSTWVKSIAKNVFIDFIRRKPNRENLHVEYNADYGSADMSPAGLSRSDIIGRPDSELMAVEEGLNLESEMASAMSKLSPEHRVTLELRFKEKLSYLEIAERLHIPIGTVMSRISIGKQRLKAIYEGRSTHDEGSTI